MLARHLLFIATRRHHNTLLAIESVPPHGIVQPPPYISPPKPEECQKEKILKDPTTPQKLQICEKQQTAVNYGRQTAYPLNIYAHDPRRTLCCDGNNKLFERSKDSNDLQRVCDQRQIVYMRNARNQQCYAPGKDQHQFYTLPSRRPQRDVEPPRSVTPDITRGLGRGSLSTMHVLARHGQKPMIEQDPNRYGSQELGRRTPENRETKDRLTHGQEQQPIVDFRNRFTTPLGLTALGYRFFASSPVRDPVTKSPSADALKYNPISPIGHSYGNSFKSCGRSMPTVAERLALTANNNTNNNNDSSLSMPNSGRSTPVQSSSGRSTPTNLILSPTKSTMSNEELFAAIHKSKKRLNIKDDNENLSPYGSTNSLVKTTPTNRNSWSSESQRSATISQNVQPPSPTTSRLDFKRLLLQQSVKTGPARLSAAEQLKLSRQQSQQQQSSPSVQQTASLAKVLSPRSIWRFQTPRTDVLSSTIIEDTAAEEKAMKPSPENTSPVSRLNTNWQQLDLCSDLPESDKAPNVTCNDRLTFSISESSCAKTTFTETEPSNRNVQTSDVQQASFTANDSNNRAINVPVSPISSAPPCVSIVADANPPQSMIGNTAVITYPVNCSQLTPSCQQAISAFESRRISNQLARAQFLASTPTTSQEHNSYAHRMFRARSESPQNPAVQNVARSPSVPTLETAL